MSQFRFIAEEKEKRLDIWLADRVPDVSRNRIRDLIGKGFASLNGEPVKPSRSVAPGDCIELEIPPPLPSTMEGEDIPLDILHEDASLIIINKPAGLVMHPAIGNRHGTLVNALLFHCSDIAGVGGEERPGIVHRLDKDTSGVIVAAKTDLAHRRLQDQFRERTIGKEYAAMVLGVPKPPSGTINAPLGRHKNHRVKRAIVPVEEGGREAVSHYEVISSEEAHALVRVKIETGRTHQIRVHMASIGHPVIGDTLYGGKQPGFDAPRQLLHAQRLAFVHPTTGESVAFEAPLPEDFGVWTDCRTGRTRQGPGDGGESTPSA